MSEDNRAESQEQEQPKVCPIMSTPDDEQTCIGDRCHFWRRFTIQFADAVKVYENCVLVVEPQLALDRMGPLYNIASKVSDLTERRIIPGAHPSFRGQ